MHFAGRSVCAGRFSFARGEIYIRVLITINPKSGLVPKKLPSPSAKNTQKQSEQKKNIWKNEQKPTCTFNPNQNETNDKQCAFCKSFLNFLICLQTFP